MTDPERPIATGKIKDNRGTIDFPDHKEFSIFYDPSTETIFFEPVSAGIKWTKVKENRPVNPDKEKDESYDHVLYQDWLENKEKHQNSFLMWYLYGLKQDESFQKSLSRDPNIAEALKEMFQKRNSLNDTNQAYIKPIIIQMCMNNDDLCVWLIQNYILRENFSHVKFRDIRLLATFMAAKKTPESFMRIFKIVKTYMFNQFRNIANDSTLLEELENFNVIRKLIGLFSKWVQNYRYSFSDDTETKSLDFTSDDIANILNLRDVVEQVFKPESIQLVQIRHQIKKLILTLIQPTLPFKNSTMTLLEASKLIISNQVKNLPKAESFDIQKLPELGTVFTFSYGSQEIADLLQSNQEIGKVFGKDNMDVVEAIIDQLLN